MKVIILRPLNPADLFIKKYQGQVEAKHNLKENEF